MNSYCNDGGCIVPEVYKDEYDNKESFEEFLECWPFGLNNFPEEVIEDWVYRHNEDFLRDWSNYNLDEWEFESADFSIGDILSIGHLEGEMEKCDNSGVNILNSLGSYMEHELAPYMSEHGTYPVPIIVAENAFEVQHPKSYPNEYMATPYQIIEGHRRLGVLRTMIERRVPEVADTHRVWIISGMG